MLAWNASAVSDMHLCVLWRRSSIIPTFSVRSGPCTTTAGGACFRSPGYPGSDYDLNQACNIAVSGSGFVKATAFDTVSGFDYVTISGDRISGMGGHLSWTGLAVRDGTSITWQSSSQFVAAALRAGFEVCGAPCDADTCLGHGSCSVGGTDCICIGGYSGPNCRVSVSP